MFNANRISVAVGLVLLLTAAVGAAANPAASITSACKANKVVSTPPNDPDSESTLTWLDATSTLTWQHHHRGDYNQDGEVNAADMVRIAAHLGEVADSPLLSLIDGDQNGYITLSDIIPVGQTFKTECAYYNIYQSTAETGPWYLVDNVGFNAHLGDALLERIWFENIPPHLAGVWYYVVHVDPAGVEGTKSNIVGTPY